eukprot:971254-Amorphochlora_amoeboformis.AAC.1
MYATQIVDTLLGHRTGAEGKVANVMSMCASLLSSLNRASTVEDRLRIVEELRDLSHQYPNLPLGRQAVGRIIDLVKESREGNE